MKTTLTYLLLVLFLFTNAQTKNHRATKAIDSINYILKNQTLTSSDKLKNLRGLIKLHLYNNDIDWVF